MERTNQTRVRLAAGLLLFCGPWLCVATLFADEPAELSREIREFKLLLDGTERGKATMKISVHQEGVEVMQGSASLEVNYIVYKYAYVSSGWEVWKNKRLQKLRNVSNYNGEKYSLKGELDGDELVVEVNEKSQRVPADSWATSYWKLPDTDTRTRSVVLLDSDQGKKLKGELKFVGQEPLKLGEKEINCSRFRITGDVQVELWFDETNRLARSESIEMGHKTIAELIKITRPSVDTPKASANP